uniref:Uncharacterized protein n=1 Tax=Acetithermum autotrophicum TaxID=1446466 RepID=H5SSL2_ACEAU|nr:hypothetical protein HGMM_OP3C303 [Candidatus Acetothermum autotrophicum]
MKKWRVVAVCTVGLVLALLLLGGVPSVDQVLSVTNTNAGVVYAAQNGIVPACLEVGIPTSGVVSESAPSKLVVIPRS